MPEKGKFSRGVIKSNSKQNCLVYFVRSFFLSPPSILPLFLLLFILSPSWQRRHHPAAAGVRDASADASILLGCKGCARSVRTSRFTTGRTASIVQNGRIHSVGPEKKSCSTLQLVVAFSISSATDNEGVLVFGGTAI